MSALCQKQTRRCKRKDRLAAVSPKSDLVFDHATSAAVFFFLRQPSRPNALRPLANNDTAPGRGVEPTLAATTEPLISRDSPKQLGQRNTNPDTTGSGEV